MAGNTNTGTVDLVMDDKTISRPNNTHNVTIIDTDESDDWSNEESEKLQAMIKSFKEGLVKYPDLEGPAYRRSRIDLWKRPAIPAGEMEQHWLK